MGKKARKEREERRDSFAAKRIKQKRKNSLIMGAVLAAVLVIISFGNNEHGISKIIQFYHWW